MSAPTARPGLEVTTHRTVTATSESPDGMTLDELAGLLRRAMAAGIDPHTPIRVRTRRNGAVVSASVEGVASGVLTCPAPGPVRRVRGARSSAMPHSVRR